MRAPRTNARGLRRSFGPGADGMAVLMEAGLLSLGVMVLNPRQVNGAPKQEIICELDSVLLSSFWLRACQS